MKGNRFFSASMVELIKRIRRCIFVCMVQEHSVLAGYRSRIQIDSPDWSLIIVTHNTFWYTLTRTVTIITDLMWYLLMSPGPACTTLILLFLRCNISVAFLTTWRNIRALPLQWYGLMIIYYVGLDSTQYTKWLLIMDNKFLDTI